MESLCSRKYEREEGWFKYEIFFIFYNIDNIVITF